MARPLLSFCLLEDTRCVIQELLKNSVNGYNEFIENNANNGLGNTSYMNMAFAKISDIKPILATRILKAHKSNEWIEAWIRISGSMAALRNFERILKETNQLRFQTIYQSFFNSVYRIMFPREKCCQKWCPIFEIPHGIMSKSIVMTPDYVLLEVIASRKALLRELENKGCRIIRESCIEDMNYMLTHRQELILIYAYMRGYYKFPREVGLNDLARELNLSVSTLSELLRKAENKIVHAFILHELPHYLCTLQSRMKDAGRLRQVYHNIISEGSD